MAYSRKKIKAESSHVHEHDDSYDLLCFLEKSAKKSKNKNILNACSKLNKIEKSNKDK